LIPYIEETAMASRGKKKPTMAKLNREARLRERRAIKDASKQARQQLRNEPLAEAVAEDASTPPPEPADPALVAVESAPT
jgi:hypothetical protein